MHKIVINNCYGGFGLSETAQKWLKDHYGIDDSDELQRHDPRLVECVETLGDEANERCANLIICTIDSNRYRIDEYDGFEFIEVPDSISWVEIK